MVKYATVTQTICGSNRGSNRGSNLCTNCCRTSIDAHTASTLRACAARVTVVASSLCVCVMADFLLPL